MIQRRQQSANVTVEIDGVIHSGSYRLTGDGWMTVTVGSNDKMVILFGYRNFPARLARLVLREMICATDLNNTQQ